jgi:hypothetical protein
MIKRFKDFIKEAISGTELVGSIGPGYGRTEIPNTITNHDTKIIDLDGTFYTTDDYNELYIEYLKKGGTPLFGFNKENLMKVIHQM